MIGINFISKYVYTYIILISYRIGPESFTVSPFPFVTTRQEYNIITIYCIIIIFFSRFENAQARRNRVTSAVAVVEVRENVGRKTSVTGEFIRAYLMGHRPTDGGLRGNILTIFFGKNVL